MLSNSINDAESMTAVLEYKGFEVSTCFNKLNESIFLLFNTFIQTLKKTDEVLIYYAGHAIQHRDSNLLLSIDFDELANVGECLTIDCIQNKLNQVSSSLLKIIIIDACRNNPGGYEDTGLIDPRHSSNTLIAFSTSPGKPAFDGITENSYYTQTLIKNIKKYNISINKLFCNVRETVIQATSFQQVPWEHSSLTTDFHFDNIQVPTYLNRLYDIVLSPCYSIKYSCDKIYLGGKGLLYEGCEDHKINTHSLTNIFEIEELDANGRLITIVGDERLVVLDVVTHSEIININYESSLFTVSVNSNDNIFVAGMMSYALFIQGGISSKLDLKSIISQIYSDPDHVKSVMRHITIMCSEFSPLNPDILAFGGSDGLFCIKNARSDNVILLNKDKKLFEYTYSISFSGNGKYIATSHESGKVSIWNSDTHKLEKTIIYEDDDILSVKFSRDSKYIVFGTPDGFLVYYDYLYEELINKLRLSIESERVNAFDYDLLDSLLVSVGNRIYQLDSK